MKEALGEDGSPQHVCAISLIERIVIMNEEESHFFLGFKGVSHGAHYALTTLNSGI